MKSLQSIPPVFHYVWVGGEIKPHYLKSIKDLSGVAYRNCFNKTIIWTDDEKIINKPLSRLDLQESSIKYRSGKSQKPLRAPSKRHPKDKVSREPSLAETLDVPINAGNCHIEIRNINELVSRLKNDPIFSDKETNALLLHILNEAIGNKNLAAVSDLIRYCSLYYFGGYYLDTDLLALVNKSTTLVPDKPKFGIIGHFRRFEHPEEKRYYARLFGIELPLEIEGNNDAFGVVPRHPILRVTIKHMLNRYAQLQTEPVIFKNGFTDIVDKLKQPLGTFERDFLSKLTSDKNAQNNFMSELLNKSFELHLLNNVNFDEMDLNNLPKRTRKSVENDKAKVWEAIDNLIDQYTTLLKVKKNSKQSTRKLAIELIGVVQSEIKNHKAQYSMGYEFATEQDAKRFPFVQGTSTKTNKRRANTCLTGVNSFCDAIEEFVFYKDKKKSSPYTENEMEAFPSEELTKSNFRENLAAIQSPGDYEEKIQLAGCDIRIQCDKTWLQNTQKKVSYDDSDLPSKTKYYSFFKGSDESSATKNADRNLAGKMEAHAHMDMFT
ncbi:glycosyltransferase [Legionella steigerwaltii]|uniref:Glycosyltransferase n=1 Tax=Legionella steigerwaltii TaxID=460 RepID=A0A378L7Z4_9GAMM|nr:glycosyltransferase [Legionella steigerwaltii]KTD81116.1 glycosyltransferase [Legionella steigerwaltii]STY23195.1 glycosyltransferase [Legionella steigerwaltii]